jgi:hypothetical protein
MDRNRISCQLKGITIVDQYTALNKSNETCESSDWLKMLELGFKFKAAIQYHAKVNFHLAVSINRFWSGFTANTRLLSCKRRIWLGLACFGLHVSVDIAG